MSVGTRIKQLREAAELSRQDLADRLKISYYTVAKYETDDRKPDIDTLSQIASILNVSTDYLLGRSDKRTEAIEPTLPEDFTPETFAAKVAPELEGYSELPDEAKQTLKEVLSFLYNKYGVHKKKED